MIKLGPVKLFTLIFTSYIKPGTECVSIATHQRMAQFVSRNETEFAG